MARGQDDFAPRPVARVAVIGAGTMGHGVAQVAACGGLAVRLHDVDGARLETAMQRVRRNLDEAVDKGKLAPAARDAALGRLGANADLAGAVADADLVIEAAPEDLGIKRDLFRRLGALCARDAILATNTSGLSVTEIAAAVENPARVVGMHFFNPPWVLKLLEIVRAQQTSDAVVEAVREVGRRMDRDEIVVSDSPGFASSRLGIAIALEAIRMVEEGVAAPADIDRAMELGYRHPMGPLKLTDLVGLDVRLAIADYLHRELGERFRPPQLLRKLVRAGKLGRKTGEGFYRYDKEG
jgi:3-hydroxybutyryl-CoA dehydrogenase